MNVSSARQQFLGRSIGDLLSTFPIFCLLILTLVVGTGEMVHGQLLKLGESMFGDPANGVQYWMLRVDPVAPTCNPNVDVDAQVAQQIKQDQSNNAASDDIDNLFAGQTVDAAAVRQAVEANLQICKQKHEAYNRVVGRITPQVKVYRAVEKSFFSLFQFGAEQRPMILLLIVAVAMLTTTLDFHHICIRPPRFRKDFVVQAGSTLVASLLLLYSAVRYYQISSESGIKVEHPLTHVFWITLFLAMSIINLLRLFNLGARAQARIEGEGKWWDAFKSMPMFAALAIISGVYFLLHGHDSGLIIYINRLLDTSTIYLQLALYIWGGMLLKQSRIVDLFMNVLRPWKLSPEMLTYIVLLAAALPTAYTGASGIFVLAAGGIIYHEVREVGGSRQFALAATAMSGSLGVVLRPCLLVVLITALNKEVTTTHLYHWGFYVFLLTSTLFFIVSQLHRTQRVQLQKPSIAVPLMLREIVPLLPFLAVVAAIILFYQVVLNTQLNEISAATIMPVMMILVLVFDKVLAKRSAAKHVKPKYAAHRKDALEESVREATRETTGHIGALISLMAMSLAIAGVVERSDIMEQAPRTFANVWIAMSFLVVTKVILGMFMDPFGAVILVSSTLAPIAYENGIDPVHFWMMVLVAFELGYLMTPVALNQLLTRQVIGEHEILQADQAVKNMGFYRKYERWILPTVVMTIGLIIVAYGPLAVQQFEFLAPLKKLFI